MFTKPRKTVDGVMTSFNKTISDLDEISTQSEADINSLTEQKAQIETQIAEASTEANRAQKIGQSLRTLIGEA